MEPMKVYAGYSKNQDMRMSSSSGAVFSSLAGYVLKQQGIVYGVKMSEDCYSAEFTRVSDSLELAKLRGSKYLQAKLEIHINRSRKIYWQISWFCLVVQDAK